MSKTGVPARVPGDRKFPARTFSQAELTAERMITRCTTRGSSRDKSPGLFAVLKPRKNAQGIVQIVVVSTAG